MKYVAAATLTLVLMASLSACAPAEIPQAAATSETSQTVSEPIGAYMIVQGKGYGPGDLAEYAASLPPIYAKYGGRYVVFETDIDVAEGDQDYLATIVSAWPSKEAARAFWDSPEYAEAIKLREGIGTFDVSIVGALPAN